MAFERSDVVVREENLPSVFPESLEDYGRRPVISFKREELLGLAKKVWEEDAKKHPIYAIVLADVKELRLGERLAYCGVSEAYVLDHTTR